MSNLLKTNFGDQFPVNKVFIPVSKTFASVDSFGLYSLKKRNKTFCIFQVTVNAHHKPPKPEDIRKVLAILPSTENVDIDFIYIVSPDLFTNNDHKLQGLQLQGKTVNNYMWTLHESEDTTNEMRNVQNKRKGYLGSSIVGIRGVEKKRKK